MTVRPLFYLLFFSIGVVQLVAGMMLLRRAASRETRMRLLAAGLISSAILFAGFVLNSARVANQLPTGWSTWLRAGALIWAACVPVICALLLASGRLRPLDLGRRRLLMAAGTMASTAPIATTGIGFFVRKNFELREVDILIPGLPDDLDGLRLVQISDPHVSPFLSEEEFAYAIDMANDTKAHVALVTGDLITTRQDPLDAAIRQIARLKAEAGVLGCLGNHETYARAERYTTEEAARAGVHIMRNRSKRVRFGGATVNFVGVDYQPMRSEYLPRTAPLVAKERGTVNILLSHNPDVFRVAAQQGFDLTVAGHTHGGQVSVEILHQHVNVARFFTPYTYGLYRENGSAVYVTRGIGTVGIPARIGAPPEIALLRLCAA